MKHTQFFERYNGLSFEQIREDQIQKCLELKYHKALGLSEEEFRDANFFPPPEEKANPLAVIPEIVTLQNRRVLLDIPTQMFLLGERINYSQNHYSYELTNIDVSTQTIFSQRAVGDKGRSSLDLKDHKDIIDIPDKIHWIYEIEDGYRFWAKTLGKTIEEGMKILKKEKRTPLPTIYGISLIRAELIAYRDEYHDFILCGSRTLDGEGAICLNWHSKSVGTLLAGSALSSFSLPSFKETS
jgi:hypothetical protein